MENYEAMNAIVEEEKTFKELWEGLSPQYAFAYTNAGIWLFLGLVLLLSAILIVVYLKSGKGKFIKHDLPAALFILGVVGIVGSAMYRGYYDEKMVVQYFAMVLLCVAVIYSFIVRVKFSKSTIIQCTILSVFLFIFLLGALISEDTEKMYITFVVVDAITAFLCASYFVYSFIKTIILGSSKGHFLKRFKRNMLSHILVLIIIVIGVLLSLEVVGVPILYDHSIYYKGMGSPVRWEFTTGMARRLHLATHRSSGFTLFMLPGVWLFKDYIVGVRVFQLVYYAITVGLFYGIICYLFSDTSKIGKALMTAIFAFSPAVFGMIPSFNPDYMMMFLVVWFIYVLTKEDYIILQLFFGWALIMTKETAVFLMCGLILGCIIVRIRNGRSNKHIIGKVCVLGFPITVWSLDYFIASKKLIKKILKKKFSFFVNPQKVIKVASNTWGLGSISFNEATEEVDLGSINQFRYASDHVIAQFKNIFCMNFIWLLVIIAIICIIVCIVLRISGKTVISSRKIDALIISSCMMGCMMLIMFFYVTFTFNRYAAPMLPMFLVFLYVLVDAIPIKKMVKYLGGCVILCLFIVQCYTTIDPVMRYIGKPISLGDLTLYNYDTGLMDVTTSTPSDYTLYNRQNWYWGGLLNKVFSEIDSGEHSLMLIPKSEDRTIWGAYSCNQELDQQGLYFDEENKRYSPVELSDVEKTMYAEIVPDGTCYQDDEAIDIENYNHWYYLKVPFGTQTDFDVESAIYNAGLIVDGTKEFTYRGCKATLYTLSWDWDRLTIEES